MRRIGGLYEQCAHARRVAGGQLLDVMEAPLCQRACGATRRQDAYRSAEPPQRGDIQVIAVQVRKQHSIDRPVPLGLRQWPSAAQESDPVAKQWVSDDSAAV